ncbi:MAG: hypothetical protein ACLFMN_03760 [Desulfobacterales bacterium]
MTRNDDDDIGSQVSSRLEELFGEEDDESAGQDSGPARESFKSGHNGGSAQPGSGYDMEDAAEGQEAPDSPLKQLKALVFGIDWEVTDESMKAFLDEVGQLQARYQNDKILHTFLKLHESVGKYIKAKKARASPEAFKFVQSVFKSFEKAITEPDISESARKRLLSEQIRNFKDFKEKLAAAKKAGKQRPQAEKDQKEKAAEPSSTGPEVFHEEPGREEKEYFTAEDIRAKEEVTGEEGAPGPWEEPVFAGEEAYEPAQFSYEESPSATEEVSVAAEDQPEEGMAAEQGTLEIESGEGPAEEKPAEKQDTAASVPADREALDYIVEELKKTIREEFHSIKQIIRNLDV